MFRNDTHFAIKMKNKFNFTEVEIKYLLGESHQDKFKDILNSQEPINKKPPQKKLEVSTEKDKKENLQQSLLDF
jgi:hypothetical protein